ncbi:hypothetical protein LDENG_00175330 [Lucifuga dentata]|nr:hypothetical protein LDENG_00175330 [Lucifuga dentata]
MPCIDELVQLYFRIGFSNKEVLSLLAHKHSLVISIRTLKRLCQRLRLFRRKNHTNLEELAAFLQTGMLEMDRCEGIDGYICAQYKEDMLYHKT